MNTVLQLVPLLARNNDDQILEPDKLFDIDIYPNTNPYVHHLS